MEWVQQSFVYIHNVLIFVPELFSSDEVIVMPKHSVFYFSHYSNPFLSQSIVFEKKIKRKFLRFRKSVGICHFDDRIERWQFNF
jgi:hypothetical protein